MTHLTNSQLSEKIKNGALVIDKIDYGRVSATAVYLEGAKSILAIFYYLLFDAFFELENHGNDKIKNFSFFYKKSDFKKVYYKEIGDNFLKICSGISLIKKNPISRKVTIGNLIKKIIIFARFFKKLKPLGIGFEKKCIISSVCAYAYLFEEEVLRYFKNNDAFCVGTFCDVQIEENLITQIANKLKIPTITLQHGQYRFIDKGQISSDVEAYANFTSEKLLCWGEGTIVEFKKAGISSDRFLITGSFRNYFRNKEQINFENNDSEFFGVVFNGENSKISNFKLIDLANDLSNSLNMKYIIRAHPLNRIKDYSSKFNDRFIGFYKIPTGSQTYYDKCKFSILHSAGVFLEFLENKHLFFVLNDGFLEDVYRVDGLVVNNVDDVMKKYLLIESSSNKFRFDDILFYYNDRRFQKKVVENYLSELLKGDADDC